MTVSREALTDAYDALDRGVDELFAEAQEIVNVWRLFIKNNYKKHRSRNELQPRARRIENNLSLDWGLTIFVPTKGKDREPHTKYIRKGKGYKYPMRRLTANCPDWTWEQLEETEEQFAILRKQAAGLARVMKQLHIAFTLQGYKWPGDEKKAQAKAENARREAEQEEGLTA